MPTLTEDEKAMLEFKKVSHALYWKQQQGHTCHSLSYEGSVTQVQRLASDPPVTSGVRKKSVFPNRFASGCWVSLGEIGCKQGGGSDFCCSFLSLPTTWWLVSVCRQTGVTTASIGLATRATARRFLVQHCIPLCNQVHLPATSNHSTTGWGINIF